MGKSLVFKEPFHISSFYSYLACPRRFLFSIIHEEMGQWRPVKMVLGTAIHHAIEIIHEKSQFKEKRKHYDVLLRDCIDAAEFEGRDSEVPVRWRKYREEHIDSIVEKFGLMLKNYSKDINNIECEVLYNEVPVEYDVMGYRFAGRIDQIRKNKDGEVILVDFKTGKSKYISTWNLKMNYQLGGYAMASKQVLGLKIDRVGLYRFQDHGEYYKWTALDVLAQVSKHHHDYVAWRDAQKTYDISEFEAVKTAEKIKKSKTGKVKPFVYRGANPKRVFFRPGQQMGPGLYSVKISDTMLDNLAKEIQRVCAAIKRKEFFRNPYSCSDCRFKTVCENDLEMNTAKDEVAAITGF